MDINSGIREIVHMVMDDRAHDPYGSVMHAIGAIGQGAHLAEFGTFVPTGFFSPSPMGVVWGEDDYADEVGYLLENLYRVQAEPVITCWVRVLSKYHELVVQAGKNY